MNGPMQRNVLIALAALVLVLGATVVILLVRGPSLAPPPAPPHRASVEADAENAADPYAAEMGCIDRLIQRNDLDANQVESALGNCRRSDTDADQPTVP